ncbi:MAG TPA: YbhB/YbcL family Raf kinase inhibitor-like protein [Candidatus Hydrogenedentes bacterium]|jgi:hypothetical protein|nr:YbhB/YbcL family Raf kinase inhibitor-like protein [Candidatus Hydrogenedentota bacterium]
MMRRILSRFTGAPGSALVLVLLAVMPGCQKAAPPEQPGREEAATPQLPGPESRPTEIETAQSGQEGAITMKLTINSPAFADQGTIPRKYTGDGEDVSPPLAWTGAPAETRSFALICDDPDAPVGTWVHWVLWNIPATETGLAEAIPADRPELPNGAIQGVNDFRKTGYGGPAPPRGPVHRYFFKLYALDRFLDLAPGAGKDALEMAMSEHILASTEMVGRYGR